MPNPDDTRTRLWVVKPYDRAPGECRKWLDGRTWMLQATLRWTCFTRWGWRMAARMKGAPGLRPYGPDFYACYLRDPDGNKLSAVCQRTE